MAPETEKIPRLLPLQRFWKLLQPDSKEIRSVYVYAFFAGVISLSLPLGIQAIVNLIQGGRISAAWIVLVSFVVLGVAVTGVLQVFQLRITENLRQGIFVRAAFEFAYRLPRIKMEKLYRHYTPELTNRFFDTIAVEKGLSKILIDFSTAAFYVVFGLLLLSFYHPFFIVFSVILVILVLAMFGFTTRKGLATSIEESTHKYRVAGWLEELARITTTIKLSGKSSLPLGKTDQVVTAYLGAREKHFKILIVQYSLLIAFKVVVAAGLLAIGGILVMEQRMNIGQFIAAEIIILSVLASVEKLVLTLETIYDVLTGLEKIAQVTDLELDNHDGLNLKDFCENQGLSIAMNNVYFAYPEGHEIITDVSFQIESGDRVAICGPNGSGKSTLLSLIAGLYEPKQGTIAYNGLPKGNLDLDSLRETIGDCLSHSVLFEGTILENIQMGRERVTFENVRWAASSLGLTEFIDTLPKGYGMIIAPQGQKLPRSIVKRILLARSIASNPKLLLLEDALVDFNLPDRRVIIDFLTSPERSWTLIAATSDPYLIEKANKAIVLHKGSIIESGKTDTLNYLTSQCLTTNA